MENQENEVVVEEVVETEVKTKWYKSKWFTGTLLTVGAFAAGAIATSLLGGDSEKQEDTVYLSNTEDETDYLPEPSMEDGHETSGRYDWKSDQEKEA